MDPTQFSKVPVSSVTALSINPLLMWGGKAQAQVEVNPESQTNDDTAVVEAHALDTTGDTTDEETE